MKKFTHIISLGHFCSPAMEFERIGCRKHSFPFDWLITPEMKIIMELIESRFKDFLEPQYFYQLKQHPSYYRNVKLNIDFYHDFSPLKSFHSQFEDVKEKYTRRIDRFYEEINKPTLFCRYITQNDYMYITENHKRILSILKQFNKENEIIYVATEEAYILEQSIPVYYVQKDTNENVCRIFLEKSLSLKTYILDHVEKAPQQKKKPFVLLTFFAKLTKKLCLKLNLVYHHEKQV